MTVPTAPEYTYNNAGFDNFFQRRLYPVMDPNLMTPYDRNVANQGFTADRIEGGQMVTANGNMIVNLNDGYISILNGGTERIRLGNLGSNDGQGIIIKDANGNPLVKISDNGNYIQGASGNLKLDFDQEYILVSDNGLPRVLLGKHVGGF